jgi:hypothetical protein
LGEGDPKPEPVDDMADQQEVGALLAAYHQVPAEVRSKFLRLVRSIADEEGF